MDPFLVLRVEIFSTECGQLRQLQGSLGRVVKGLDRLKRSRVRSQQGCFFRKTLNVAKEIDKPRLVLTNRLLGQQNYWQVFKL